MSVYWYIGICVYVVNFVCMSVHTLMPTHLPPSLHARLLPACLLTTDEYAIERQRDRERERVHSLEAVSKQAIKRERER